jgi:hypothetical protein
LPTTTRLSSFGLDQSLKATPGYDDVTGVGTPAAGYFTSHPAMADFPGMLETGRR